MAHPKEKDSTVPFFVSWLAIGEKLNDNPDGGMYVSSMALKSVESRHQRALCVLLRSINPGWSSYQTDDECACPCRDALVRLD